MSRARGLAAALAGLALGTARADLLVDDFSLPQTVGTTVIGPMLFGQRSLSGFPGSSEVVDGVFRHAEQGSALLRYGPAPGAEPLALDFRLAQTIDVSAGSAGHWPSVLLILYSGGGTGRAVEVLPDAFPPGGGPALLSVPIHTMARHGDFDLAHITGLALDFGDMGSGVGPVTVDAIRVTGTVPAVPEAPPGALLALGLGVLTALRRWRALRT